MELCFDYIDDCDDKVEYVWVKMRGKAKQADILLGVCYRPPNQDEEADEVFYKRLAEVSQSLAPVLVGDFNLLEIQHSREEPGGSWSVWKRTS